MSSPTLTTSPYVTRVQRVMEFDMFMLKGERQMTQKNYKLAAKYFGLAAEALDQTNDTPAITTSDRHHMTPNAVEDKDPEKDNSNENNDENATAEHGHSEQDQKKLSNVHLLLGKCHENLGKLDLAQKAFSKAIVLDGGNVEAITCRALIKKNRGFHELARDDLNLAIELSPNDGALYFHRGNVKKALGKTAEALADYTFALSKGNAPNALVYNNRANLQLSLQQYDRAIEDYSEALKLRPNFAVALKNRGVLYFKKDNRVKAVSDFTKAIDLMPNDPLLYTYRGIMYRLEDQLQLAMDDFSKSIALSPTFALAFKHRSELYQKQKLYIRALVDIKMAFLLSWDSSYDLTRYQIVVHLSGAARAKNPLL